MEMLKTGSAVKLMLKWQKNYYVGEKVEDSRRIKRKINAGKYVHGIYLLTLSDNPSNLMEIVPAAMLMQKSFREICPLIFGMAKGSDEALEMVRSIVDEVYRETGAFRIEEYIKNR